MIGFYSYDINIVLIVKPIIYQEITKNIMTPNDSLSLFFVKIFIFFNYY